MFRVHLVRMWALRCNSHIVGVFFSCRPWYSFSVETKKNVVEKVDEGTILMNLTLWMVHFGCIEEFDMFK